MITATINDYQLPPLELEFLNTPQENATDVVTLDGSMYTDFVSVQDTWTFNYTILTKAQYDAIRAIYDSQFTAFEYPLLSIPFYDIEDQPARMYINDKDIWNHCGDVRNIKLIFRPTPQLTEDS